MFVTYTIGVFGLQLGVPLIYKNLIDIVSSGIAPELVANKLIFLVVLLAITIALYNTFYRIADWAIVYAQSNILKDVANDAYKRLNMHSYEFFTNRFAGSLVTKLKRFVRSFETIFDQIVYTGLFDSIKLFSIVVALAWFAAPLLFVFAAWLPVYALIVYPMIKKQYARDVDRAAAETKSTGVLADTITNVLNIKMFAAWRTERKNFNNVISNEKEKRDKSWYYHNFQNAIQSIFVGAFEVLLMYFAVNMWLDGTITAGVVVLAQIYVLKAFEVTWNMGRNIRHIMEALADAQEMVEIFEMQRDVKDLSHPEKCKIKNGAIEMRNITFAYEYGNDIFKDLSLTIKAGEKVGLVGHSGSGKTTITKLLLRFADIQSGEILVDGQNIARIKQDDLRKNISYVPQEPMLFHRSLSENISYAKPEASKKEIQEVAKKAHAHEFIENLNNSYDTLVGERGIKLSGGERQRVAIARAMLKDAPILILDEATSALDSISEKHIQAAFDTLMKNKTTVVIAHRLSTIEKMDRIIVFDKGCIVEEGTHLELVKRKGEYYKFWKQQNQGVISD